jgi:hypothetical protein
MRAFVNTDSTANTERLRDVRFSCFFIHNDAFLPVTNRWAVVEALIITLLWLTIVFLQNCNTHVLTSFFPELHCQIAFASSEPPNDGNERFFLKRDP